MSTADRARPARREALRGLALGALVAALSLLAACGSDDDGGSTASSTSATETTSADEATASPLEGTWRTAPVSPSDAEEILTRAGLSEWIDEFRSRSPFGDATVLVLEIGDEWDLYGESDGEARVEIDYDATYEVEGDEVVVLHSAGSNTFRWAVDGDTLTLEHLETSMPAFEGVPEEVFQRALYMTAEFTRDP